MTACIPVIMRHLYNAKSVFFWFISEFRDFLPVGRPLTEETDFADLADSADRAVQAADNQKNLQRGERGEQRQQAAFM